MVSFHLCDSSLGYGYHYSVYFASRKLGLGDSQRLGLSHIVKEQESQPQVFQFQMYSPHYAFIIGVSPYQNQALPQSLLGIILGGSFITLVFTGDVWGTEPQRPYEVASVHAL